MCQKKAEAQKCFKNVVKTSKISILAKSGKEQLNNVHADTFWSREESYGILLKNVGKQMIQLFASCNSLCSIMLSFVPVGISHN